MLKTTLALSLLLSMSSFSYAQNGIIRIKSTHSVTDTAEKLTKILSGKGMTIFNRIEHSKAAKKIGVTVLESELVIFGNPKIGSHLIKCSGSVAIDLPQKALISMDEQQVVWISYNDPQFLKQRHDIQGCDKIIDKVSGALSKFVNAAAN